jgi:hypothetical protein
VRQETPCSGERPPKTTATRSLADEALPEY